MAKRERNDGAAVETTGVLKPLPLSSSAPGSLSLLDGESVRCEQKNTDFFVGSKSAGTGTLFVTTERLAWVPQSAPGQGFVLLWPDIVLHAICRDPEAYDKPCVFCQLASSDEDADAEGVSVSADAGSSEVRLVPADTGALETIFEAMSACAELHPDMEDDDDDEADSAMMGAGLAMGGEGGGG
jgi:hypothetical protein